jgi:hypothetical protein
MDHNSESFYIYFPTLGTVFKYQHINYGLLKTLLGVFILPLNLKDKYSIYFSY